MYNVLFVCFELLDFGTIPKKKKMFFFNYNFYFFTSLFSPSSETRTMDYVVKSEDLFPLQSIWYMVTLVVAYNA